MSRRVQSNVIAFLLFFLAATCARGSVAVTEVVADNREVTLPPTAVDAPPQPLRLPASNKSLRLRFQSDARDGQRPLRLRFKLEGVDADWRDLESEMVVWLRLMDKSGQVAAGDAVKVKGESPGWNGHPENAPLTAFRTQITAPKDTDSVLVYFNSYGGAGGVGQMVVDAVRLSVLRPDGTPPQVTEVPCSSGRQMASAYGDPDQWQREGERPELAQVLWRTGSETNVVLFLNDDDPDKYGVWRSQEYIPLPLKQGDRMTLECRMAYTIGCGGPVETVTYGKLKPGTYWFRVVAVKVSGVPTGIEASLPIVIAPPLTQRAEFWIVLLIAVGGILMVMIRQITQRRMLRQVEQAERRRMLEEERTRIARDIHDDLGATMTQIAMLSEVAQAQSDEAGRGYLRDIFARAHAATRSLDEIVWSIKPENDALESLIRYLCQFAEGYLSLAGLRFRLDAPETMPRHTLTSNQRHNLFLTAKEALHNVVKHARATEVWLRVQVRDDVLHLIIEDNGTGQVPGPDAPLSRGSANMKKRIEQIGGRYSRTGAPGRGTIVEIAFPMKDTLS